MGLLIKVVKRAPVPYAALENESRAMMVHGESLGGVSLKLDGIGTGFGRRLHDLEGPTNVPIVVAGHFGNQVRRMTLADRSAGYLNRR